MEHIRNDDSQAVTFRAVAIGAALSFLLGVALPYAGCHLKGSRMGMSTATPAAFFLLLVLTLLIQPLLRLIHSRLALRRGELLTVFIMCVVATALPTRRIAWGLGMITGTFYWGAMKPIWVKLILPNTTRGLAVTNAHAVRQFYDGATAWADVDWSAWLPPLLTWALFLLAFHFVIISIMVILRKQWVENERLTYPVTIVPLEMMREPKGKRILGPFFKSPLMWIGFLIPFVIESMNALSRYYPGRFPAVPLHFGFVRFFSETLSFHFRINFLMLGLAFFIETRLLFSMVFFYIVMSFIRGYVHFQGFAPSVYLGRWTLGYTSGAFAYMFMGAVLVCVVTRLWAARRHLRAVWRGFVKPSSEDDSEEIMSYRFAVVALIAGLAIMWGWLTWSGLPWWVSPVVIVVAMMIFIVWTRLVAQGGMTTLTPAMVPVGFVIATIGSSALGARGATALGYTSVWAGGMLMYMMAPVANSLKLGTGIRKHTRALFWAMLLAIVISMTVSSTFLLKLGFTDGATNLHPQYFSSFCKRPGELALHLIRQPTGPYPLAYPMMGVGAVIMAALSFAQTWFPWWPLHPLGFVVAFSAIMGSSWLSVFVAWVIKSLLLRYGGPVLYRRIRPLFCGIVLGVAAVGGVWLILDALTGTVGNQIPMR